MNSYQKLLQPRSDFEFHTGFTTSPPKEVIFCGKLITSKTEPGSARQMIRREEENTSDRNNVFVAGLRSPSGRENRWQRSSSDKKSYTGIFGTVKFPLQMELSDMKTRQDRKLAMTVPKFTAEDGGEKSCWELIRPLRRRGKFMSSLKSSFRIRCISIA